MAFVNSIKTISQGFGSAGTYSKREAVATNVGTVVITIPSAGTFSSNGNGPGVRTGRIRVKTASLTATGTVQRGVITATDGTSLVTIAGQQTALAADKLLDETIEFCLDFLATSMTVTIIAGTANSTHDVEIAGTA